MTQPSVGSVVRMPAMPTGGILLFKERNCCCIVLAVGQAVLSIPVN